MDENIIKIFFFGDSICFGQGVSLHKGWVTKISAHIDEMAQEYNKEILLVNSAVNGRTTRQALESMPFEVQSHRPTVLIVQFGMNDCNYWETDGGNPRVSINAFEANLEEIITRALSFGTKFVFLNTNHPSGKDLVPMPHTKITYEESNRDYNTVIRKVAEKNISNNVILNDMESVFKSHEKYEGDLLSLLLPDKLHLNTNGHLLYYNTICPRIESVIRKILNT